MREKARAARLAAGLCGLLGAGVFVAAASDQPADDNVGIIDGENIVINGPMSMESVGGQTKTVLRSGSDVRVKSGEARISLVEGGQVSICGPAHLSVLKSGGTLTIALESGVVHVRVEQQPDLTIYTAQIQAKPVAIGDDPRDLLVGFESPGVMCIRTYRGALRLETQLGGESVIVPQGGDVLMMNGELETLRDSQGHCKCELQMAKASPAPMPPPKPAVPAPATAAETAQNANVRPAPVPPPKPAAPAPATAAETAQTSQTANGDGTQTSSAPIASAPAAQPSAPGATTEKPAAKDEKEGPVYHVDMPPLVFDATAKVQPEPDPKLMMIVRRVRVRPTLIFQGRVEGEPPVATEAATPTTTPPPTPVPPPAPSATKPQTQPQGFLARIRAFFHRLWSHSG